MGANVPAVSAAIDILRFLQQLAGQPASMAEIARATSTNPSTCFNILRTLQGAQFVVRDSTTKRYRLGPALLDLALAVAREMDAKAVAMPLLQQLVQEVELGTFVVEHAWDEHFVVVDRVESTKDVRVSVAIGTRFPPNVPAFARAYLAWRPAEEVERFLARWGVPHYTPQAVTDVAAFWRQLAEVRAQGFAVSRGEYRERYRSLAAPVFNHQSRPIFLLAIIGFASDLADGVLPYYGRKLAATAAAATRALGGQPPAGHDACRAGPPAVTTASRSDGPAD